MLRLSYCLLKYLGEQNLWHCKHFHCMHRIMTSATFLGLHPPVQGSSPCTFPFLLLMVSRPPLDLLQFPLPFTIPSLSLCRLSGLICVTCAVSRSLCLDVPVDLLQTAVYLHHVRVTQGRNQYRFEHSARSLSL